MFSNNWFLSKNGAKREIYNHNSISHRTNYSHIPNDQTAPKRMETKIILTIFTWLGVTSYVWALFINSGTWKADVLWGLAVMFGVIKVIRYGAKTWQEFRRDELEIKAQKKKIK